MNASFLSGRALFLLGFLLAGCVSATMPRPENLPAYDHRRVSSTELMARDALDLIDALHQCRPHFLIARGGRIGPVAYLDGVRLIDLDLLRDVRPREVVEVRFLPGLEATTRFGAGHTDGVILVTTR